jgi:hypothetical protein
MKKDGESRPGNDEHKVQISLDSIADMAGQMSNASDTMEIIGIASPDDIATLQQQNSHKNKVIKLPNRPTSP